MEADLIDFFLFEMRPNYKYDLVLAMCFVGLPFYVEIVFFACMHL